MKINNEQPRRNWRQRVSDLDHVPGEEYDIDAMWKRMEARLDKAAPSKARYWLLRAASVLLGIFLIFSVSDKKSDS